MKIYFMSGWKWCFKHCWLGYFKMPTIRPYGPYGREITILGVTIFIFNK